MLELAAGVKPVPLDNSLGPLTAVVMVVVVVGFAIFMTFSIRGKIAKRNAARPSARELVEQMKNHPRVVAADAQGHAAILEDTARRLSAQLDNKSRRLEKLIDDADRRIATLGLRTAPAATAPTAAAHAPPRSNGGPANDALTQNVYELSDAGRSSLEIAQRLDEQVGKIELILALRV